MKYYYVIDGYDDGVLAPEDAKRKAEYMSKLLTTGMHKPYEVKAHVHWEDDPDLGEPDVIG